MEIKRYGAKEFLAAGKLCIRENEIHIWCICWPEMTDFWVNHEYILSGQESEQVGRFRFSEDRMGNRLQTRSIMFWISIWKIARTGYRERFILSEMALHRDI